MERKDIVIMLSEMNLTGIGVEVGTYLGEFSEVILDNSRLSHLYSIDSWQDLTGTKYEDVGNHTYQEHMMHKAQAVKRLSKYNGRNSILHMFSAQAVERFEDCSLDFVYIDAHHTYESCSEDIALWFPKVRVGGVFAGHDYIDDGFWDDRSFFGVKRAVNEFIEREQQTLHLTDEEQWRSWYVIKEQL